MCTENSTNSKKENSDRQTIYSLKPNIQNEILSFGVETKLNDYIGVQKSILPILERENYFREITNEESGMIIEITKKGIKETLGSGKRFQSLPRKIKEFKIATLRYIPEIIRVAHLVEDNIPNFHQNSPEYAYFLLETNINGISINVRIDVKKTSSKNKFWLHMIDINEKNPITQS